jgi:branched-chain amino acid transport system ATP-binding protein
MMLELRDIDCFYGDVQVLRELSLTVDAGNVLCLLGRNGAGKTTTLKAIMGLVKPRAGSINLDGADLTALAAHEVPGKGVAYVPQGRRLFADLSVRENLEIGLMARGRGEATLDRVLTSFPVLRERFRQRAGTLSGGEQQMLAMARALCIEPKVMLLDEPTEGLMPSMIATIRDSVRGLREQGVATILVEQRVDAVLPVADRIALIETGRVRAVVDVAALRDDPSLLHRYVGVGH